MFPYKFFNYLLLFYEKYYWYFDRVALNLYITLDSIDILTILSLSIHEHRIYLLIYLCLLHFLSSKSYSFHLLV